MTQWRKFSRLRKKRKKMWCEPLPERLFEECFLKAAAAESAEKNVFCSPSSQQLAETTEETLQSEVGRRSCSLLLRSARSELCQRSGDGDQGLRGG